MFHDSQFEILTQLKAEGLLPLQSGDLARARQIVEEAVTAEAQRYEDKLAPAIPRVWEDGINSIRADLREWLRRMAEEPDGWVPDRFELSFGITDRDRAHADPASVNDSIPITGGLQLRGSIDLVERQTKGVLRATDHKTGKARAKNGVIFGGGAVLQPVLYGLACEKILGDPVQEGRLYYCTLDGGFEERLVPLDNYAREGAGQVVEIIGRALSEGFFPAYPDKGACRWCDYRLVCGPREEIRTKRKPKDRLDGLITLRNMP
jgi:CRISPR/Cas system-associated exonuclease Cas4 (RecB family)